MASAAKPERITASNRIQFGLYRAIEPLVRRLPPAWCHGLGMVGGTVVWAGAPRYRRLVARNLRIAGGLDGCDPALGPLVRRTIQRAGANLVGGVRTALVPLGQLGRFLEAEGTGHLARARAEGRGVIQVLPHMGNWELLAQATWLSVPPGMGVGAVYRPLNNPLMDALVRRRRASQGTVLFSRKEGFHQVSAFLRHGNLVGVLSDQRAGREGVAVPFFGRLSSCSGLPELLARRTGAMLVTTSLTTVAPGRWRVRYRPVEDPSTAGIMAALAAAMDDGLSDVFWLHDRWRVHAKRPLSPHGKRPARDHTSPLTKPLRLVVSASQLPPAAGAAIEEILAARPDARIEALDDGRSPALPASDRVRRVPFDPALPPAGQARQLARLDRAGPHPLDAAILLDGNRRLAAACWRLGLDAVVGATLDPVGPPWTNTAVPPAAPADAGAWRGVVRTFGAAAPTPSP